MHRLLKPDVARNLVRGFLRESCERICSGTAGMADTSVGTFYEAQSDEACIH